MSPPALADGNHTPTIGHGQRVLLIDDDPTQLKLNWLRLREAGFAVGTAGNAGEALQKARERRPDVIVSDVIMGDIDGFSLCRMVREDVSLRRIPVILLSSHYGGTKDHELATRVGAYALVTRTPDFDLELETVAESLVAGAPNVVTSPGAAVHDDQLRNTNIRLTIAVEDARRAEQRYRALFDNAADMISVLTPDGLVVETNQRSLDILGVGPEQLIGRHVGEFVVVGQEERLCAHDFEQVKAGQDRRVVPVRRPDGGVRYVEFSTTLIQLDGDTRVLSVGRDVTEERRLEEGLRHAQKVEALGRLTAGIAHDFNNVLAIIMANSDLLLEDLAEGDPRREDVAQIAGAAHRAAGLTRQLLAFSRQQVLQPTVVDLNTTVSALEKLLQRLIGEDIDLSFVAGADLGRVRADVGQLEQVVMNLVVNARDAMPSGGRLSLETSNVELVEDHVEGHWSIPTGRYVVISVTDSGCGMDAATQHRILEPFFTTKEPGKGTGLGLSTCFGIVTQSGGSITVCSALGQGTTFKIYLPRVDADLEPVRISKPLIDLRGTESILLIEDDAGVREGLARILQGYGYHIIQARDANEAVAIAHRREGSVDLVLCDVVIPGIGAPHAVNEIQKRWPHAKVLFMSGYSDHPVLRQEGLQTSTRFIQKPFASDALAKTVRLTLEG